MFSTASGTRFYWIISICREDRVAFDDDASDDSSSGNDSDNIIRAISADILSDGESNRCLGLHLPAPQASAPQPRPPLRLPRASDSVVDVKRDDGCKCLRGDCIDNFGGGEVLLTRTINGGLDKEHVIYGLGTLLRVEMQIWLG